jgi:hypothetical protein
MSYFLEYIVPAGQDDGDYEFPVSEEHRGYTVPLTEVDVDVVRTDRLPVRTEVFGASLDEAKTAAEEILSNSKASQARLFDDPSESMQTGAGTLIASYAQGSGWQDQPR